MNQSPILISGFGSVGRRHFRNLKEMGFTDFVFSRSMKSAVPTDEIAGYPQTSSLEEALGRHPRVAFVTNPTSLHLSVALRAARAGCHLFIEKPLSNELTGCDDLSTLCQSENLVTMIGCQHRFHPLLLTLRDGIRNGKLGMVLAARAEYGDYLPAWHPWENHRTSYSARRDLGGGVILTLIHPIDYLYWLFGPVSNVEATASRVESLQTDVDDDMADITLHFDSGVIGDVHLDYVRRPPIHSLIVRGETGGATLDFLAGRLSWDLRNGAKEVTVTPQGFERNAMFVEETRHFLECVEEEKPTLSPLQDGIEVLKIALKAKSDAQRRKQ